MEIGDHLGRFRFVLRDRDTELTAVVDAVLAAEAMEVLVTPVRVPRANAHAERWVGAVGVRCWTKCSFRTLAAAVGDG